MRAQLILVGLMCAVGLHARVAGAADPPKSPADPPKSPADPRTKTPSTSFSDVLSLAREARCATAICWGVDNMWAIEPLVELPIGKTFALATTAGTLDKWVNSHELSVTFNAGLRFWAFSDWVSISMYFSQPLLSGDHTIHVPGSSYEYPTSNIRRPYPGVALGFLGDALWIGLDYQELVNGDAIGRSDPNFALNERVSRSFSMTIGLAAATSVRSGIGTALAKKAKDDRAKVEADRKAAEEKEREKAKDDRAKVEADRKAAAEERKKAEDSVAKAQALADSAAKDLAASTEERKRIEALQSPPPPRGLNTPQ